MLLVLLLGSAFAFLIFALYLRYCHHGRLVAKIPGPPGLPFIGNAFQLASLNPETTFKFFRDVNKKYGPLNKMNLAHVAMINISHPDDVETLLSNPQFQEKRRIYNFLKPWLGDGLGTSNGEKWKQRRKMLAPTFHVMIMKDFCNIFNDHTERLLTKIQKEQEISCFSIIPLISKTIVGIMCDTLFGISMDDNADPMVEKYLLSLNALGLTIITRGVNVWLYDDIIFNLTALKRQQQKLIADVHSFTEKIIEQKKAKKQNKDNVNNTNKRQAMLDLLLEEEEKGNIDLKGIREEVDTFLFRGHDTLGMAMSFMIMRLANETEIQEKAYQEIVKVIGESKKPTMEDLNEMKYLDCCVKESMRIYPPVPLLVRHITEDVVLGKYKVPEGVTAFTHIYDIHHDPTIYPKPELFIPERFLPEATACRNPFAYMTFSGGRRNCIGQKFAMLEMKMLMSGLLRRFQLEPVTKPEDVVLTGDLVLRPNHPLYVRFKNRVH